MKERLSIFMDRMEEIEKISNDGCEGKDMAAHSHFGHPHSGHSHSGHPYSGATEIRRMVPSDISEVERIEKENFSRPWTAEDYRGFLDREDADFLVAVENGRVVGYIGEYGIPDEGDITNVSVDRKCRNRHIGRKLVLELIRAAEERGIRKIFLEVRESNAPAIRLYENAGFRKTGIRRNYYTSPMENAVLMMRESER